MTYSFSYLEPVCCSMSSSNCCFFTCIQVFQKEGKVALSFHPFKNIPQFVVIHTVKGFSLVSEAEVDVFLEFPCFLHNPVNVGNLISGFSAFSKSSLYIWKFLDHILFTNILRKQFVRGVSMLEEFYDHTSLQAGPYLSVGTVATLLLDQLEDLNTMEIVGSLGNKKQVMTLNHQ